MSTLAIVLAIMFAGMAATSAPLEQEDAIATGLLFLGALGCALYVAVAG